MFWVISSVNTLQIVGLGLFVEVALVKRLPAASGAKVSPQANASYQLTAHSATL